MNIWDKLTQPFFVLAPMDDVTDTVFRRIIGSCAAPDVYFTEFVNADGLQSPGRKKLLPRLRFTEQERPIIAQIWGKNPENFYKTAQDLAAMGYDGIDLNFGCPIKNVVQNGACSAFMLPENRERAVEIIQATKEGASTPPRLNQWQDEPLAAVPGSSDNLLVVPVGTSEGVNGLSGMADRGSDPLEQAGRGTYSLPVSVKTRLGFNDFDPTWHELLLKQKLNALSIHGRTRSQMSKVPADWDKIGKISKLRDTLSPATKIIGNGDVMSKARGSELAAQYSLDGIMIGRGVFEDPFVFAESSPWHQWPREQKLDLYRRHVELFAATWHDRERPINTLNRFCKIYINGFEGAKELRERLMNAGSTDELVKILTAV